jgi:hypothetical protein
MKDIPHHMMKFMQKMTKTLNTQVVDDNEVNEFEKKITPNQIKKQKKSNLRKQRCSRTPIHESEEERNKELKKRIPLYRQRLNKKI